MEKTSASRQSHSSNTSEQLCSSLRNNNGIKSLDTLLEVYSAVVQLQNIVFMLDGKERGGGRDFELELNFVLMQEQPQSHYLSYTPRVSQQVRRHTRQRRRRGNQQGGKTGG